ncbi:MULTISPECIES: protein-disulfide reductase DsbD family protein [unclassified Bradyrhizobium]|uniref:protein-disulfide reductase DsbD family protein n=1 Tax=unclassified Bradyrhizobium TaxID=2631580 RepID=UPI0028E8F826|nr:MULTISPECIES: protein-disulfide reductase DsbD domain-containing protein [unclassified Bradyrhizobium]
MSIRLTGLAALLLGALQSSPEVAVAGRLPQQAEVDARLLIGDATAEGSTAAAWAGLDVRLAPGWHTYWRSAGDAGAPPEFDWSGSRNVADVSVEWPAPRRFSEQDIDTFGYVDHVLFPLRVRLQDGSAPAHLALKAVLYVCSEICTQQEANLQADISPTSSQPDNQAQIDAWRQRVPRETSPTLSITSLRLERQPSPQLRLEVHASPSLSAPDVFIDGDVAVSGGRVQASRRAESDVSLTLPVLGLDQAKPYAKLRVTLVDGDRSLEAVVPDEAAKSPSDSTAIGAKPTPAGRSASIWAILGIALLGGFILNFMPCVFPVLSLKLVSLVDHGHPDSGSPRSAFLATAVGIVASFGVLAATLSILKASGSEVGWGLQFQQPAFLITMIVVLAAFGANLLGLFEITLPFWITGRIGNAGMGRTATAHVFNGFVMTLLATPCSAPFVGTAVTFALSQQAPQIMLVFTGLGLGMALPYLSLAAAPGLAALFPRPGRWMLTLRALAAAAMLATALWLLTILAEISGPTSAALLAITLLSLVTVLAARRFQMRRAMGAAGVAVMLGLAVMAATRITEPAATAAAREIAWQPLVPADIATQVRAGRTVFVDIGAAWCVTCKVNEKLVIDSSAVRHRLTTDVVPVKADWTTPNEAISAYLRSYDRYGLPFNAVFGPKAPTGILLPELLTQKLVLDAIDTASATSH